MKLRKRAVLALASITAVGALGACGGGDGSSGSDDDGPITIGFFHSLSGVNAGFGQQTLQGAQLAVKLANADGGVDGRDLELKTHDDQDGSVSGTINAVRALQDSDILMGGSLSAACAGAADAIGQTGKPTIYAGCSPNEIVSTLKRDNAFHIFGTNFSIGSSIGRAMKQEFPDVNTWDLYCTNNLTGFQIWNSVYDGIKAEGGDVSLDQQVLVDPTATDTRTQVSQLAAGAGDASSKGLFLSTFGAATTTFLKGAEPYGLTDKYAAVATSGAFDLTAWSLKGTSPQMWNGFTYYYGAVNTPENAAFVKAYEDEYDGPPSGFAYQGYTAVQVAIAALEETKGDTDAKGLIDALGKVTVKSPAGEIHNIDGLNQYNTPVVVWKSVGDPSAPQGLKVLKSVLVPAQDDINFWQPEEDSEQLKG
ncbi:ABC transporter substrate-binding protein [Nocardioides agariphilus]|uniref:ABC transporter substrate-binding protein n=1 Tax=Nocardioides agariphilus TaxID=433664 RepID=A0A930VLM2_9ACTN|nr:ABC transporter substrate-binding protein [Nocardioides agariphilus]MBF4769779.1 ABC transporter substrate-binding protein [Nocardioides agariphilus]